MNFLRLTDNPWQAVTACLDGSAAGIAPRTSGSTGEPREVLITGASMRASSLATLDRLGGPGHWLLAMPADRIAGAMVIARAHLAGAEVGTMPPGPFTAEGFAAASATLPPGRRYVSLVPTQVRRVLADPAGVEALTTYDAVLVGGAPPGMNLPANATETYGMTETSGGCVYDGVPLTGAEVRIGSDGRIEIAGPMLAEGYRDGDDSAFIMDGGRRWLRTNDLGSWDGQRLTVHGRADHVIITGGHNVHPATVERALADAGVAESVVVGLPDHDWGQRIVAVVAGGTATLDALQARLNLPRHALPRTLIHVDSVPRNEAGKIDRNAARAIAAGSPSQERT